MEKPLAKVVTGKWLLEQKAIPQKQGIFKKSVAKHLLYEIGHNFLVF